MEEFHISKENYMDFMIGRTLVSKKGILKTYFPFRFSEEAKFGIWI